MHSDFDHSQPDMEPEEDAPITEDQTIVDIPIPTIELQTSLPVVDIPIPSINLFEQRFGSNQELSGLGKNKQRLTAKSARTTDGKRKKSVKKLKYRPASTRGRTVGRHKEQKKGRKQIQEGGRFVLRNFAACPRCSYFLSGYRVLFGKDVVVQLEAEQSDGWLGMPWTRETRSLLQRSFGIRTDIDYFFWEHACDTCCRRIVFEARPEEVRSRPESAGGPQFVDEDFFWVELKTKR